MTLLANSEVQWRDRTVTPVGVLGPDGDLLINVVSIAAGGTNSVA
jgi:hypothetical protein